MNNMHIIAFFQYQPQLLSHWHFKF